MRFKTNLFYHIWIWSSFEDLLLRPGEGGIHPYFLLELVWFHFAFDPWSIWNLRREVWI